MPSVFEFQYIVLVASCSKTNSKGQFIKTSSAIGRHKRVELSECSGIISVRSHHDTFTIYIFFGRLLFSGVNLLYYIDDHIQLFKVQL